MSRQNKSIGGHQQPVLPDKMTLKDVARFFGVTERTVRRRVKSGLSSYKVGRHVYFRQSDLFDWIESCRRAG